MTDIHFLGVPFNSDGTPPETEDPGQHLRNARLLDRLRPSRSIVDCGDLTIPVADGVRDPDTGVYRYDIFAGDGKHRVWLTTAASLRERLDWIGSRPIGGIVVEDLLDAGNGIGTVTAVHEFKVNLPSSLNADLVINWAIVDASGNLLVEASTDIAMPLTWTPDQEGEYVVSADLVGVDTSDRGAVAVIVGLWRRSMGWPLLVGGTAFAILVALGL